MEVDPDYHPKIIGKRGSVISKIRDKHGVQINFPRRDDPDESIITIQGYEDKANAAKEDILAIVHELVRECIMDINILCFFFFLFSFLIKTLIFSFFFRMV